MSTSKIYTRTGDHGQTSLVDGTRISKSSLRLECYGTVDELNSFLGLLIHRLKIQGELFKRDIIFLEDTQNALFNLGSRLACLDVKVLSTLPQLPKEKSESLEGEMDLLSLELPPLRNFILPGGAEAASFAHICRTVTRRAERHCVSVSEETPIEPEVIQFLNRLSDYFFILARSINHRLKVTEQTWRK